MIGTEGLKGRVEGVEDRDSWSKEDQSEKKKESRKDGGRGREREN